MNLSNFIRANIIFLIIITLLTFIPLTKAEAKTTSFYEGEYIPNIWMNRKNNQSGIIYYNQARIFREANTNNIAYCIEPFIFFNENYSYTGTTTPNNFTQQQIEDMILISHFGYGYGNHLEQKWYAITQFMLWKTAEPNATYYFSNYKNGPPITMFESEINEITSLINNYKKDLSFNNQTYTIVENQKITITDTNNIINTFKVTSNNATIIKGSATPDICSYYKLSFQ